MCETLVITGESQNFWANGAFRDNLTKGYVIPKSRNAAEYPVNLSLRSDFTHRNAPDSGSSDGSPKIEQIVQTISQVWIGEPSLLNFKFQRFSGHPPPIG
jgi:hypothetical protein